MMKMINLCYLGAAIGIGAVSIKFLTPVIAKNGTAVIAEMSGVVRGGGAMAIKLPDSMTKRQHEILNFAYEVAKADGFNDPKYLQGIIMQESKAGSMNDFRVSGLQNKPGDRYFGIGQIKLVAAKDVMKRYPELWKYLDTRTDEELQARLIVDDQFNVRVASKYALIMGINKDAKKAITAYNLGQGGAQFVDANQHHYTVKVQQHIQKLK